MDLWNNQPLMDFIGYLGQFFFIFAVCLFAFNVLSEFIPKSSGWQKYERKVDEWRNRWMRKIRGAAQSMAAVLLLSASCLGALIIQAWRLRPSIITQHNVVVYGQGENGDWNFTSDEEPGGDAFRPCPDERKGVDDMLRQASVSPPYIADYAKWEELVKCKSISRSDLGFFFKDEHNNFTYRKVGQ